MWDAYLAVPDAEIGASATFRVIIEGPQGARRLLIGISSSATRYTEVVSGAVAQCLDSTLGCEGAIGQLLSGRGGTGVGPAFFEKTRIRDASQAWRWYVASGPVGPGGRCTPGREVNLCPDYYSREPPFAEWVVEPSKEAYQGGVLMTYCCTRSTTASGSTGPTG